MGGDEVEKEKEGEAEAEAGVYGKEYRSKSMSKGGCRHNNKHDFFFYCCYCSVKCP